MKRRAAIAVLLLGIIALWSAASATDIYVDAELGDDTNDGSEASPWQTITHALASVEGSEEDPIAIHVAAGTYSASTNGETFPLNMKSWVSIIGEGPATTVLDAEFLAHHVINCSEVGNMAVEGFTIARGRADGEYQEGSGGGIYCEDSNPIIAGNWIGSNEANSGAGISCQGESSPLILDNTITYNTTEHGNGGGICCTDSSPTIQRNMISRNNSGGDGGGIYCSYGSSPPTIIGNTIAENAARNWGGGLYYYDSSPVVKNNAITGNSAYAGGAMGFFVSSPVIEANTIALNSATDLGGGIFAYASLGEISKNTIVSNCAREGGGIKCWYGGGPTISCNSISDNSALHGGGISCTLASPSLISNNAIHHNRADYTGGAMNCFTQVNSVIINNVITNNSAGLRGGAISCNHNCSPTVLNNIIVGNTAGEAGGAVYCRDRCSPEVSSSTLIDNWAGEGGGIYCFYDEGSRPDIHDCIVRDNHSSNLVGCSASYSCIDRTSEGEGNVSEDPMFMPGRLGGYYLHPDSPCVDTGSESAVQAGLSDRTTQTDGMPDTAMVDMGYHYPIAEDHGDVEVSCSMNASEFRPGDVLQGSMSVENGGMDITVDIFAVIVLPDGSMISFTQNGFAVGIKPWLSDLILPSGFAAGPVKIFELIAPAEALQGGYTYLAAVSRPEMGSYSILAVVGCTFEIVATRDITMMPIPDGSFLMGSPSDESGHDPEEGPRRTVNISAFQMSETEVTQAQWEDVMGWDVSYFIGYNHPVEQVTWFDCVSFCNKLSQADGYAQCYTITNMGYAGEHITSADVSCDFEANGYRLPTEAEWEYACRAGTTTRFNTGDSDLDLGRAGWHDDNSGSTTHTVGGKEGNAWGLYDMHGNVIEWCWDWFGLYGMRPDPDSDPRGASSGSSRVIRSGGWVSLAQNCRSANRFSLAPRSRYQYLGFRIVRSVN